MPRPLLCAARREVPADLVPDPSCGMPAVTAVCLLDETFPDAPDVLLLCTEHRTDLDVALLSDELLGVTIAGEVDLTASAS